MIFSIVMIMQRTRSVQVDASGAERAGPAGGLLDVD